MARVLADPGHIPPTKHMPKRNDILPPPRPAPVIKKGKVYLHALLPEEVIHALKIEAHRRNYSTSDLLEHILRAVLPK